MNFNKLNLMFTFLLLTFYGPKQPKAFQCNMKLETSCELQKKLNCNNEVADYCELQIEEFILGVDINDTKNNDKAFTAYKNKCTTHIQNRVERMPQLFKNLREIEKLKPLAICTSGAAYYKRKTPSNSGGWENTNPPYIYTANRSYKIQVPDNSMYASVELSNPLVMNNGSFTIDSQSMLETLDTLYKECEKKIAEYQKSKGVLLAFCDDGYKSNKYSYLSTEEAKRLKMKYIVSKNINFIVLATPNYARSNSSLKFLELRPINKRFKNENKSNPLETIDEFITKGYKFLYGSPPNK